MKKFSLTALVALTLAGCDNGTPTQTIDWYKQHDTERKEQIAECDDNPGKLGNTPNCINAKQADNEESLSRRGLAPLAPVDFSKPGD